MEEIAIENSLVCLVFDILKAAVRKVQVPFLESPETLQARLYLQNEGFSRHETLQLFLFLFPLQRL